MTSSSYVFPKLGSPAFNVAFVLEIINEQGELLPCPPRISSLDVARLGSNFQLTSKPMYEKEEDFNAFIAAYLPSLLDRYRRSSSLPAYILSVMGMDVTFPYIGRYMRSFPGGFFLLEDHFRLIATVDRWDLFAFWPGAQAPRIGEQRVLFNLLINPTSYIIQLGDQLTRDPAARQNLLAATRSSLRRLYAYLEDHVDDKPTPDDDPARFKMNGHILLPAVQTLVGWIDLVMTTETAPNPIKVHLRLSNRETPWLSCEAKGVGPCETREKDAEILGCSRCKTVRYCSHAHQKSHWKVHKLRCFECAW